MLPNVAETQDPLNLAAMPSTTGMELDYRTGPLPEDSPFWTILRGMMLAAAIGMGFLIALRVAGLVHFLTSPFLLACVVLVCTVSALYLYLRDGDPFVWLTWVAAGPTAWLLIVLTRGAGQFLLCLLPIALATYVARQIVRHYGQWTHANPYLSRRDRLAWLRIWEPRVAGGVSIEPERLDLASEQRERRWYLRGYWVIPCAAALALLTYGSHRPFAGFVAMIMFIAVVLLFGVLNCADYRRGRVPLLTCARLVWRAFVSWLTYNLDDVRAPGLFVSPCGSAERRSRMTIYALAALTLTIVPLASYFPIVALASSPQRWIDLATTPWPWQDKPGGVQIPPPPSRNQVLANLTDAQRVYLNQLPSADSRRAFLNQLATAQHRHAVATALKPAFDRLTAAPESWLLVALNHIAHRRTEFVLALIPSVLGSLLIGPLVLLSICFAVGGRVLTHFHLTLDVPGADYQRTDVQSAWDAYQQRMAESRHVARDPIGREIRERDHLFVGLYPRADYPILLHEDILTEHAHFTGDSGSGKSSLGVAPLVTQLIGRPNSSVVVLDLKGDRALFECARIAAEQHGLPFRWVTNRPNEATYAFNPFLQQHFQDMPREQLAEILLKSLGLEYGEGYGTAFFSAIHRDLLIKLLTTYPEVDSFRLLRHYLVNAKEYLNDIRREQLEQGVHLLTTINILSAMDALNVTKRDALPPEVVERRIDTATIVSEPNVVYFYLHAQLQESTVREVAKLALHSLLTAAVLRTNRDHQVYLFVDEFQQIVSGDLKIVLQMARDSGIAAILANQSVSDLTTRAVDLRPTVQANTRFKQIYSATDLVVQDELIKASGEGMYEVFSVSENPETGSQRITTSQQIGARLRRNDIIQTSDAENLSIAHVSRSRGFSQFGGLPFQMYSPFHITLAEYKRRKRMPWPRVDDHPGTFVPPLRNRTPLPPTPSQPPPPAAEARPAPADAVEQQRISDIEALLDEM